MKSKHTPGPWEMIPREAAIHIGPDADRSKAADTAIVNRVDAVGFANARLIAAAPEMLEALKMARDAQWAKKTGDACVLTLRVAEAIEAAIAKAEGRE